MQIKIHDMKNLTEIQQSKIRSALLKGEAVLDSELWASKIRNAQFTEDQAYSGKQIVGIIRSGVHNGGLADNIIDVSIEGFYKYNNVVGYTHLGSTWQWINRKYLDRYNGSDIFGHVMHETMHRCHLFKHLRVHKTSVPYLVGTLSAKAYRELAPSAPAAAFHEYGFKVFSFV